ncbi:MAG: transglutaminase-like domain-containing protein, partial [Chloracidobacterium sp.]
SAELATQWRGQTPPPLSMAAAAVVWALEADREITDIPKQLDALADELSAWAIGEGLPQPLSIEAVSRGFVALGFRGETDNYYDPRNSFLAEVITRRVGIPITLSVIFIELAQRFGLTCEGVNFPGHFLVRYRGADGVGHLDPFHGCQWLDDRGLQQLLHRVRGTQSRLSAEDLATAGTGDIVARMLRNLCNIALKAKDWITALRTLRMLVIVNPDDAQAGRDIGLLYLQLERWGEALTWLESHKRRVASDAERQSLEPSIIEAKKALAQWN